jgi:glutamyl-tRNA synthetase
LQELQALLATADFSSDAALEEAMKNLATSKGLGFGEYQSVARLAVSGTNVGPGITGIFRVLGRAKTLARIERLLATL